MTISSRRPRWKARGGRRLFRLKPTSNAPARDGSAKSLTIFRRRCTSPSATDIGDLLGPRALRVGADARAGARRAIVAVTVGALAGADLLVELGAEGDLLGDRRGGGGGEASGVPGQRGVRAHVE